MVIGTFSDIEARQELQKDKWELIRFPRSVTERADYIRRVKKATRFPFNYIATFKSSRGNRYKVILTPTDKKKGAANPLLSVFTSLDKKEGTYILRYDMVTEHVSIFTPHFFKRYRERFLKDEALSSEEVRDKFLLRNFNITVKDKMADETVGTCLDGYIFIRNKDRNTSVNVTFYSPDMLTEEQRNNRADLLQAIKKHEEKVLNFEE